MVLCIFRGLSCILVVLVLFVLVHGKFTVREVGGKRGYKVFNGNPSR